MMPDNQPFDRQKFNELVEEYRMEDAHFNEDPDSVGHMMTWDQFIESRGRDALDMFPGIAAEFERLEAEISAKDAQLEEYELRSRKCIQELEVKCKYLGERWIGLMR
jgi:hypothetical protein